MFNFSIRDLIWFTIAGGLFAAAISQRLIHQQQISSINEVHQNQINSIEDALEDEYNTISGARYDAVAWAKYALTLESKLEEFAVNHPDFEFVIESGRPWTVVVHADQLENSPTAKKKHKPGSL